MNLRAISFWLVAVLASIGLHLVAFAAIAFLVSPDPFDPQDLPKSQIDIKTQDLKRVAAKEKSAEPEAANESSPEAKSLGQGAFPKSKVGPTPTSGASMMPKALASPITIPFKLPTTPAPKKDPDNRKLASVLPDPVTEKAKALSATILAPNKALGLATLQVEAPSKESFSLEPTGEAAKSMAPAEQAFPSKSLDLPAEQGQASLAWSGVSDAKVEAASLNAIQAFMQPSELMQSSSEHSEVRDGLTRILASVPCARLQATFLPETGHLELRGHIPESDLRGPILSALHQQLGNAIPVTDQLLILPRPQCGALSGIADIGLPQSTEQLTNPRVIGETGFAQNYTYLAGDRLSLELIAPDYDSFVYVDFFTADGMVIHLQPNDVVPLELSLAKSPLTVGKDRVGKPSLELTIGPPFGQEIAAAFAASSVLYEDPRPIQEPAENYLAFMKTQVAAARREHEDFKGEWVYFFISTAEQ